MNKVRLISDYNQTIEKDEPEGNRLARSEFGKLTRLTKGDRKRW